jgi:exodeoxyribonuclease VII small subunit
MTQSKSPRQPGGRARADLLFEDLPPDDPASTDNPPGGMLPGGENSADNLSGAEISSEEMSSEEMSSEEISTEEISRDVLEADALLRDTAAGLAAAGGIATAPASFEVAMGELESLVQRMEGGRLPLEESLAAYQRGVVLVKYCREALGQVAQRVRILEADLLQPFEAADDDDA